MMYTFVMALGELDLSVGAIVGFSAAMGAFSRNHQSSTDFTGGTYRNRNRTAKRFRHSLSESGIFHWNIGDFLYFGDGQRISLMAPWESRFPCECLMKTGKDSYNDNCSCCIGTLFQKCAFGKNCRAVGASREAARQSELMWKNKDAFLDASRSDLWSGWIFYFGKSLHSFIENWKCI